MTAPNGRRSKKEMNKKTYHIVQGKLRREVTDLEQTMVSAVDDIWTDDVVRDYYCKILSLDLSDRRLWLVYSLLNHSIVKTSSYFRVDRKTISKNIDRIKNKMNL